MKMSNVKEDWEVDGLPVSGLARVKRKCRYGTVPGLPVEELADPDELERPAMRAEWEPVLALPVRTGQGWIQRSCSVDFDAFGTVDFERSMPAIDTLRYKTERVREKLRDVLILIGIVSERLTNARRQILKYLRTGVIELEHIQNEDMLALSRLYLRARRLQEQIRELREASWSKSQRALAEVFR